MKQNTMSQFLVNRLFKKDRQVCITGTITNFEMDGTNYLQCHSDLRVRGAVPPVFIYDASAKASPRNFPVEEMTTSGVNQIADKLEHRDILKRRRNGCAIDLWNDTFQGWWQIKRMCKMQVCCILLSRASEITLEKWAQTRVLSTRSFHQIFRKILEVSLVLSQSIITCTNREIIPRTQHIIYKSIMKSICCVCGTQIDSISAVSNHLCMKPYFTSILFRNLH